MSHRAQNYPVDVVFDQTKMEQIDVRYLLRHVLGIQEGMIPNASFSHAVIAQFLYGSPFLTPSVWQALLRHMDVMLRMATDDHAMRLTIRGRNRDAKIYLMEPLKNSPHKLYQVIFIDAQWATWTGETGFMELQTGEMRKALPMPGVEQVAYNLTELSRRECTRCLDLLKKRAVAKSIQGG